MREVIRLSNNTEPMRVSIVCDKLNTNGERGGSNFSIHRLATELTELGHDVEVVTLNFQFENDPPKNRNYSVVEQSVASYTEIDGVIKLFRELDHIAERCDVIHCYLPGVLPIFGLWRKRGGDTPIIGHLNTYTPICSNSSKMADGCWKDCSLRNKVAHSDASGIKQLTDLPRQTFNQLASIPLMNSLDGVFALSPALAEIYSEAGLDEDLIHVVPNMFDRTFEPANESEVVAADGGREIVNRTEDGTRISYIGRVDPQKGVDVLFEALEQLPKTEDWHVDIVGDDILDYGTGIEEYRSWAEEVGIGDRVTMHGWVEYNKLPQYYERADIFVHPGRWPEPFGRTLLEALQHKCAIVTSDVGAPPWIAADAGVTFPREDSDQLASELQKLINNDGELEQLQESCESQLERFDPDTVTQKIEAKYGEVIP